MLAAADVLAASAALTAWTVSAVSDYGARWAGVACGPKRRPHDHLDTFRSLNDAWIAHNGRRCRAFVTGKIRGHCIYQQPTETIVRESLGSGFDPQAAHRFSHCATRSLRGRFRWWGGCGLVGGGWLGDAEDGDEPVGSGDGDVGDEGFALVAPRTPVQRPTDSAQLTGIALRLSRDALAVVPSVRGIVRYLLGRLVLERGQSANALVTVLVRRHARSVLDATDGLHRDRTA